MVSDNKIISPNSNIWKTRQCDGNTIKKVNAEKKAKTKQTKIQQKHPKINKNKQQLKTKQKPKKQKTKQNKKSKLNNKTKRYLLPVVVDPCEDYASEREIMSPNTKDSML